MKDLQKYYQWICLHLGKRGIVMWHSFVYERNRGHRPDFNNPKDLTEIILSGMHKDSFLEYAKYADKCEVRKYIESKGLGDILLDVYGAWDKPEDINFDELPEKFALKANNGSGNHVFCKDKSTLDKRWAIERLKKAMSISDSGYHFEPHYSHIKPLIYAEELIDTGSDAWPVDYKFTCLKGEIADVFVCCERETGHTKYITLDTDWNVLPYTKEEYLPKEIPAKPKHLDRMIEIAKILSADFDIVRVDLYEYKNKVYFSELTFSPWGGQMYSYTNEALKILGDKYYSIKK